MANTPNYNLKKPDYTEMADIPGHFNGNMDTIDTTLKAHEDELATKETPTGAQAKADTAETNAKTYADGISSTINNIIGSLASLTTTVKTSIVNALNGLQEDVDAHKADDVTQGDIPHTGLGGSISHATNTGEVTTPHLLQVNASQNSTASGVRSQVNASSDSTASEKQSQVNASINSTASGNPSQVNASQDSAASGAYSQINASRGSNATQRCSVVIASGSFDERGCDVDAENAVVIASDYVINEEPHSVAGGHQPDSYQQKSTANRKWHIYSQTGDIQIAGQLTPGHAFTDFAELFPNLTQQEQGYGLLQTIDGFGVRPAQEGERVIGVTSATAGVILGDTPFSWQGRWLKNEWGAYIYETIIDEETGEEITYPKENPEWNPELEQVSRLKRPDEWTVVGLVGQVYVRLKEDVQPMDFVKAWQNGVGQKSLEPTNLQVMKITQEYDAEKGYKIGFCLLR